MNIAEQLNLLLNIKESIKLKLLEIGAKITDETPFKEYSKYILMPEKSAITDKVFEYNQPLAVKEKIYGTGTDSINYEPYFT